MRTALLVSIVAASGATAGVTSFQAVIDNDLSGTPSPAAGMLTGEYDDVANTFSFSYEISDELIGTPAAPGAHLHNAPAGSNGPIVFAFATGEWDLSGAFVWSGLTAGQVDELFAGNIYANFHTTDYPGGEVRGQITVVPAPAGLGLLGLAGLGVTRRRR